MAKLIKSKTNFTVISNEVILNNNLSCKAKAVYCYLQSRPDDWDFYTAEIVKNFKEKKDCIIAALKELEDNNYIKRVAKRIYGKFANFDYYIFDNADEFDDFTECTKTDIGKTDDGKTDSGKSASTNTNIITNTNLTNTDLKEEETNKENSKTQKNSKIIYNSDSEDKKEKQTIDLSFIENQEFKDLMNDWLEYKKDIKDSYKSNKSIKACYDNLFSMSKGNIEIAKQIVGKSIANGYKGLFELDKNNKNNNKSLIEKNIERANNFMNWADSSEMINEMMNLKFKKQKTDIYNG